MPSSLSSHTCALRWLTHLCIKPWTAEDVITPCSSRSCLTDPNLLYCGKPSEVVPSFPFSLSSPNPKPNPNPNPTQPPLLRPPSPPHTHTTHHHHHHHQLKVQAHSFSRCAKVAPFCVGDFSLYLHVDDVRASAQCCTRCGSRQEAARATVTPVPSARTGNRRDGPSREYAPQRPTGTGQERGRGTSCTTRPRSGSAPLPKDGFCGTLWDICPCLLLMFLCRRWWTSCGMSCSSWQRSCC